MTDRGSTRRGFLRAAARTGGLAAAGVIAAALGWRARGADACRRPSACEGCPSLSDCEEPVAQVFRKRQETHHGE